MKKVIVILGILVILFSFSSCKKEIDIIDNTQYKEDINTKMQNFSCEVNNNQRFELYNRKNNKPVFINFWATWCGPCVGELPDLQKVYDEYKDKVDFIFINCGDSKEMINEFINKSAIIYSIPIGFDEKNELGLKFNISAIPTTYILKVDNTIYDKIIGSRAGDEYKELLDKVLGD